MTLGTATPATGESDGVKPQAQQQHATVNVTQTQQAAPKDVDDDDSEDEYIPRGPKTQNIVRVDDKKKGGR
ncbi:hypothetical protein M422DRAFT_784852 [Sphaerobolus stellatus SS14]|uniref:Uncharacterized protein n=1 Tax=Sphaerobolus stellatus (strain SS14) TaxID=990650 RepID=A0A0C9UEZ0_SPHS4|nr:hypothetical protein M422DRAFT_784852 [Sphaerobolus stellatus SS14]